MSAQEIANLSQHPMFWVALTICLGVVFLAMYSRIEGKPKYTANVRDQSRAADRGAADGARADAAKYLESARARAGSRATTAEVGKELADMMIAGQMGFNYEIVPFEHLKRAFGELTASDHYLGNAVRDALSQVHHHYNPMYLERVAKRT